LSEELLATSRCVCVLRERGRRKIGGLRPVMLTCLSLAARRRKNIKKKASTGKATVSMSISIIPWSRRPCSSHDAWNGRSPSLFIRPLTLNVPQVGSSLVETTNESKYFSQPPLVFPDPSHSGILSAQEKVEAFRLLERWPCPTAQTHWHQFTADTANCYVTNLLFPFSPIRLKDDYLRTLLDDMMMMMMMMMMILPFVWIVSPFWLIKYFLPHESFQKNKTRQDKTRLFNLSRVGGCSRVSQKA